MANLSSDFQTFATDDPITQLAELNNTLTPFQTMFASPFSSSLDSLFFHHQQHQQFPEHFPGKSPENNGFHQGIRYQEEKNINGSWKRSKNREEEKERVVVHVSAKRGQATDSHSLAERVRRGKINERLKCLKDIVPGCYKAMGMATMLDEIINYVHSLQNQVEFLSMKLTAASSYYDFNSEADAVDSMQKAKAREAVEMGQGRDGSSVFHSSSWTL
ncbi:hypothetical protein YC2023_016962 [Brassica napus]